METIDITRPSARSFVRTNTTNVRKKHVVNARGSVYHEIIGKILGYFSQCERKYNVVADFQ